MTFAGRWMFFLPVIEDAAAHIRLCQEVRADRAALATTNRQTLERLYKYVLCDHDRFRSPAFAFSSLRLRAVFDGAPLVWRPRRSALLVSAGAVLTLLFFLTSGPVLASSTGECFEAINSSRINFSPATVLY
jgi:hypothetical protein